jgi:hypothetical protein
MTVGTFTIQAALQGSPTGSRSFNATTPLNAAVDQTSVVSLGSGANTITVPSSTTVSLAIIVPPNATYPTPNPLYAGVLTLKGVAGDTGVVISSRYPTVLEWDVGAAPSSFVINASVVGTIEIWWA